MLTDRKPHLAHIGCRAYGRDDELQPRAWIGYLLIKYLTNLGTPEEEWPYNIIRARDVIFDETILYKDDPNAVPQQLASFLWMNSCALQAPERLAYRPQPKAQSNRPTPVGELDHTGEQHHLKANQRQQPDRG